MVKNQLDDSLKNHIVALYNRNYEICTIAELYQVTRQTIYNIIRNYKKNETVKRKYGSGRKIDNEIWLLIKKIVDENQNLSLSNISALLLKNNNISCSKSKIHRYLTNNNYVNKNPIIKPLLSEKNMNDRENWAIFYQYYNWNNVIWSDPIK